MSLLLGIIGLVATLLVIDLATSPRQKGPKREPARTSLDGPGSSF